MTDKFQDKQVQNIIFNQLSKDKYYELLKEGKIVENEFYITNDGFKDNAGGLDVLDIGQSLYVDESQGLRRYLNGSWVDINRNTQLFYERLMKAASLNPELICTEDEWNALEKASPFGQVGKFVVDTINGRVRLPKVVYVCGTLNLGKLGELDSQRFLVAEQKGTTWYRWYSDGWLEQGGQIGVNKSQDTSTVTYLKTFANNNYTLTWGVRGDLARVGEENWKCTSRSATSCTFMNNSAVYATYNWQACGYGAVPAPADYNLTEKDDVIKQLLYICVGNTTNYEGVTEVVNQGMDILEQVAQKVNVDGTNLTVEGKSLISSYAMPSSNYIDLTAGASGTTYTAPANGYFEVTAKATSTSVSYINISLDNGLTTQLWMPPNVQGNSVSGFTPCKKGQTFTLNYYNCSISQFIFIYAEGEV